MSDVCELLSTHWYIFNNRSKIIRKETDKQKLFTTRHKYTDITQIAQMPWRDRLTGSGSNQTPCIGQYIVYNMYIQHIWLLFYVSFHLAADVNKWIGVNKFPDSLHGHAWYPNEPSNITLSSHITKYISIVIGCNWHNFSSNFKVRQADIRVNRDRAYHGWSL